MASSTWLRLHLARRAGGAGAHHDAGEVERHHLGRRGDARHGDAQRVGQARDIAADRSRHRARWRRAGARPRHAATRPRGSHRGDRAAVAQAAPKPAMPGKFSVPARRPRSWPPPGVQRHERQLAGDDKRANTRWATELVRRERHQIGAQPGAVERQLAGAPAPHRNGSSAPWRMRDPRRLGHRLDDRRSRCWRA